MNRDANPVTGDVVTAAQMVSGEPRSLGGELPVTRRCHRGNHARCPKSWTAYPDYSGPCRCECHV